MSPTRGHGVPDDSTLPDEPYEVPEPHCPNDDNLSVLPGDTAFIAVFVTR